MTQEQADALAREFWERAVLARPGVPEADVAYADTVAAEWRKRFTPPADTVPPLRDLAARTKWTEYQWGSGQKPEWHYLPLSVRAYNCLRNTNIWTIAEIRNTSDGELLRTKNFGRKGLNEIRALTNTP